MAISCQTAPVEILPSAPKIIMAIAVHRLIAGNFQQRYRLHEIRLARHFSCQIRLQIRWTSPWVTASCSASYIYQYTNNTTPTIRIITKGGKIRMEKSMGRRYHRSIFPDQHPLEKDVLPGRWLLDGPRNQYHRYYFLRATLPEWEIPLSTMLPMKWVACAAARREIIQ